MNRLETTDRQSLSWPRKFSWVAVSIFLTLLVCTALFGPGAITGHRILAPLDIPPALFTHYRYIHTGHSGVPENHYIIDGIFQDLPSQWFLYQSLRAGEIPWWTPYDWGGRPFLADSHVNGLDPIRLLCFFTLPFEQAYNWTILLHTIIGSLGMTCLLRTFGFGKASALVGGVLFAFSGAFAIYFCHPFVLGTFAWYPWIWVLFDKSHKENKQGIRAAAMLALPCAAALYGANLQGSAYLPLFLLALGIGYKGIAGKITLTFAFFLAVILSAPLLVPSIEAYLLSGRDDGGTWSPRLLLMPLMSLGGIYPWAAGTFKTLDIGRFIGGTGSSFVLFTGSLTPLLAAWAALCASVRSRTWGRTSLALVGMYGIILVTPLFPLLYTRSAPLALLGIIPLAAAGIRRIKEGKYPGRRAGILLLAGTLCAISVSVIFAVALFPKVRPALLSRVAEADAAGGSPIGKAPELRKAQVDRLPSEITPLNPEVALSAAALLLAGFFLAKARPIQRGTVGLLVALNVLPVLLFYARFTPSHPKEWWDALRDGGPSQHEAMNRVGSQGLRLLEQAEARTDMLIPQNFTMLYKVHAIHGYCSLQPYSLFLRPPEAPEIDLAQYADVVAFEDGPMRRNSISHWSRFHWSEDLRRTISLFQETNNTLVLQIGPGGTGDLVRTDTRYPGWTATWEGNDLAIDPEGPTFSRIRIPASENPTTLKLEYHPRGMRLAAVCAAGTLLAVIALLIARPRSACGSD